MAPSTSSALSDEKEKAHAPLSEVQENEMETGWKALFRFTTKKHMPLFASAVISTGIAGATMPVFAILYGRIFRDYTDYGIGKIDSDTLRSSVAKYCLILIGIASLNWITNSIHFFFFLIFGEVQARSARNQIFDALIRKDMAWFDTRETGIAAFLPAIQMHIRDLQLSVSQPFGEGTQCVIQGLGALAVAFYYSWNLTLVILCGVPLIYIVQAVLSNRLVRRANEQADRLHWALKYITNAITSIESVKCFNGETYELHVFTKASGVAARLYTRVANLRSLQIGFMQFFTLSIFVQGFWYGNHIVKSGNKDVGQVITTFWAALMTIQGIAGFLPQFIVLQKGRIAGATLHRLMTQMSVSDQQQEAEGHLKPIRCPGDIEFRQVTFSYPTRSEEVAIRNVSLFFPAGETTFILGKSGSGKSTLGQLLARFYQPISGQILLDSLTLHEIDVNWLRQHLTLVEQHSVLFNESIQQNLALGRPGEDVSLKEIESAVKFSMLDAMVQSLPNGLDTELGMKGSSLSGGQKQRMALARAKIRDTPVLILDESTSALDYITRAAILRSIREWRKGKTTIVITHDISQIEPDEFMYLMEDAQVVQEGYRKELEAQPGALQRLLASHKEHQEGISDEEEEVETWDEEDEIISLYDEGSWNYHAPLHRPMSAVLFGENVLSTFARNGRESFAGTGLIPLEKLWNKNRPQEISRGNGSRRSSTGHSSHLVEMFKPPPGMANAGPGAFEQDTPLSRLDSQRRRLSGVNTYGGTMRQSKDYGSRPVSMASNRPVTRGSVYPRRLSVVPARIELPVSRKKKTTKKGILPTLKFRRSSNTLVEGDPNASLPVIDIFKSVWPVLKWRPRMMLLGALFCTCSHAASTPVFAWLFSKLLSTFYTPGNQTRNGLTYAMAILALAIGDGLSNYLYIFLADSVAQSWTHALKVEAMRRILKQPREFFDREENSMARLAETLDHFAEEARNLPGRFASIFLSMIIMMCISIIWSMITCWKLALVALATAPVVIAIAKSNMKISSHWEKLANEADDDIGEVLHETFINIRTVRCLNLESYFGQKYKKATTAAVNVGMKRALYSGAIFGLNYAGALFVAILLFYYGAILVAKNEYTVSQIVQTFLTLMLSVTHVQSLAIYITQVNISREAGSRLLRLAHMPTTSHELVGTIPIHEAGDIVFSNVKFSYPNRPDVQVLHDVSFTIQRATCVAIVGSSGSGKSTIAALLLKLYQPDTSSHLTISGLDIRDINTSSLRARMAIVSQSPVIFPGTIAENIVYGISPSSHLASPGNIRAAADAAGVSEFIDSLPNGYETLIGDGGTMISGGQAQRLAIARALVRDPDILILDEATSALDVMSAGVIRDTVKKLVRQPEEDVVSPAMSPRSRTGGFWDEKVLQGWKGKGRKKQMTVIIITHAREMMAVAERVVMLDKGRVVEQGGFGELKRKKGGAFGRLLRGEGEEVV